MTLDGCNYYAIHHAYELTTDGHAIYELLKDAELHDGVNYVDILGITPETSFSEELHFLQQWKENLYGLIEDELERIEISYDGGSIDITLIRLNIFSDEEIPFSIILTPDDAKTGKYALLVCEGPYATPIYERPASQEPITSW